MIGETIPLDALQAVKVSPVVGGVNLALCAGPLEVVSKRLTSAQALALGNALITATKGPP